MSLLLLTGFYVFSGNSPVGVWAWLFSIGVLSGVEISTFPMGFLLILQLSALSAALVDCSGGFLVLFLSSAIKCVGIFAKISRLFRLFWLVS